MQPIINTILRTDRKKEGKCAIVLQIYYAGQRKQVFTGLYVKKANLNNGVVVKLSNADYYNQLIANKKNEIEREYLKQQIETGDVILKQDGQPSRKDFFDYATKYYNGMRNRCKKDYIDRAVSCIEDFRDFTGPQSFHSISIDLLKQYEDSLFARALARNTINRIFKRIKQVFTSAGIPWRYKAVTYKQTKRDFLTIEEIEDIEANSRDHIVKWYFLLSCYTGLRYSDMNGIQEKIIKNRGVKRLILGTSKTGEVISIQINEKILGYLKRINKPIPTNVSTNRILKDIISDTSIKRNVIFHMGRHSFAVNAASLGFPIEVVSKLLGHSSIRTTAIYYKITDTKVDEWMNKFN